MAGLLLLSCTGEGRLERGDTLSPGTEKRSNKDLWESQDRRIKPGCFAPTIKMPGLYASNNKCITSPSNARHIVFFWASWCTDCNEATPEVKRVQEEFPTIPWFTISLDDNVQAARQYVEENNLAGTHLFDGRNWRGDACTDYAVPLHGIPYIILIGEDGRIEWIGGEPRLLHDFLANSR